jgi:tetratricopeptide (TPR) repeat protein
MAGRGSLKWGDLMVTLRLTHRPAKTRHLVEIALEGHGPRRTAAVDFEFELTDRDREDLRWYLEDYLQYPLDPAPVIAGRIEQRLASLGTELFNQLFGAKGAPKLWYTAAGSLTDVRVEVDAGAEGSAAVPWELLRDPDTDGVLALQAGAFVRTQSEVAAPAPPPSGSAGMLRVLLVICRPAGRDDVPFRSVASHLVRLSRKAREAFQLDVLRPPTFAQLTRALEAAQAAGIQYHVVHFDGHGAWLGEDQMAAAATGGSRRHSLVSPPRPGAHGFLEFEDPGGGGKQFVDGPALGKLLARCGVPVLVLNACRSAHADLVTAPDTVAAEMDAHQRVRAYGSLAQEVMDAGAAGVVAMRYNVYVVTAAQFIGDVYTSLLKGQELGTAVGAARRLLAADPMRDIGAAPLPLQDWVVPVVYEAMPLALLDAPAADAALKIGLSQADAGRERARLDPSLPAAPDTGFLGRDETLLALDRAFDTEQIVLLHAWAGAGKTSTALEFARWYSLTGAVEAILLTPFTQRVPLARLLDQVGDQFGPVLEHAGIQWAALGDADRRDVALQVLAQIPVLWVWDNVEQVAGFPSGTPSAWTPQEQRDLAGFLRDLAASTQCKVLLTSRREEGGWLGDLPRRVSLPGMPMLECLALARGVAKRQPGGGELFLEVEDWRPLLEFSQGNPLTVIVLVREALREQLTSRDQIEGFVAGLRAGAARVVDDAAQGRDKSLAASLSYGLDEAFTDNERAVLALLALFQGFADTDALRMMGGLEPPAEPVPQVAGLTREQGIALLDRAAEVGLLTSYGGGYFGVHPAVPWHLENLFEKYYGPPGSSRADSTVQAWTRAIGGLGNYYTEQYAAGHTEVTGFLEAEEANLLRARQLAIQHGWMDVVMGTMQGLARLYDQTGRAVEWRRLVDELIPLLADPGNDGPLPGFGEQWALLRGYRADIATADRDWPLADQLANSLITWWREQAADALGADPEKLDAHQRYLIQNLAAALEQLGAILCKQEDPGCVQPLQESAALSLRLGSRREEAVSAFDLGHAYKNIPSLRDLDQAEHWYKRALELFGDHDTLGRANAIGQLGSIAIQRFFDARKAGEPPKKLAGYLGDATAAYLEELDILPDDAVNEHAVAYNQLGIIYREAGGTDQALSYFLKSIQYEERQDNTYGAGQSRLSAAFALARAGRADDALLYARAALRDHEAVGPSAAGEADRARRLIASLEQGATT